MPTLKDLRLQARLSYLALAQLAGVDRLTVEKAERGQAVRDVKAYAIVEALNKKLGKSYSLDDIEGLKIL